LSNNPDKSSYFVASPILAAFKPFPNRTLPGDIATHDMIVMNVFAWYWNFGVKVPCTFGRVVGLVFFRVLDVVFGLREFIQEIMIRLV
jgi:hypothetical protein